MVTLMAAVFVAGQVAVAEAVTLLPQTLRAVAVSVSVKGPQSPASVA